MAWTGRNHANPRLLCPELQEMTLLLDVDSWTIGKGDFATPGHASKRADPPGWMFLEHSLNSEIMVKSKVLYRDSSRLMLFEPW